MIHTLTFESGARLGPYEIVHPLDSGGMGEVYRARDTRLDRLVAVKIIRDDRSRDPKQIARFEREARVVSALAHPNVCQLYDVGSQDGTSFLVMEHIEGQLSSRLLDGPVPTSEVVRIGAEVASALDAAHRRQIVHRDVKPSNIMLSRSGAKLLDFGIARREAPSSLTDSITQESSTPGTLAYMAPEQISGMAGDSRSDIWALGAVLYEMLTGVPPFRGASRADLMTLILSADADLDAIANPNLRRIIQKCLAKDPEERWQSARDLAQQLRWSVDASTSAVQQDRRMHFVIPLIFIIRKSTRPPALGWSWRSMREAPCSVGRAATAPFSYPQRVALRHLRRWIHHPLAAAAEAGD